MESTNAPGCTCGKCVARGYDDHGNVDYGYEWDNALGRYVGRECEVAFARRVRTAGENRMLEEEARRS